MGTSRGWTLVVALVSCVALLGCEKKTEHVLGAILPVTGVGAAYGADIKRGMELELEAINDAGGINGLPLRIVFELPGALEVVSCIAADVDVGRSLPALFTPDLKPMPISSLEQVATAFANNAQTDISQAYLRIVVN